MKVIRPAGIGTPLFVLPDTGRQPLAGPFDTAFAARLWIVQHIEAGLAPAKLAVWREVSAKLPAPTDLGLELGLIGFVARGMSLDAIAKYIPRTWRAADRRMLAAGDVA